MAYLAALAYQFNLLALRAVIWLSRWVFRAVARRTRR